MNYFSSSPPFWSCSLWAVSMQQRGHLLPLCNHFLFPLPCENISVSNVVLPPSLIFKLLAPRVCWRIGQKTAEHLLPYFSINQALVSILKWWRMGVGREMGAHQHYCIHHHPGTFLHLLMWPGLTCVKQCPLHLVAPLS